MRAELATPERLSHYIALRRRERWQMGGGVFVAGLGGIVLGIALLGAFKLSPTVMPYVFVGPILVAIFGLVSVLRWWQRRTLGVDGADFEALNKAFERALLRKQDLRFLPDDAGVAVLRKELGFVEGATTATLPAMPVFSDEQLGAWFKVQGSLQTAIAVPGLVFAVIAGVTLFLLQEEWQPLGTTLSVVGAGVAGLVGHRRHRRIRGESGLTDHDLGTLRAASVRGGLNGAKGTPEDLAALRKAVADWHRLQHGS